MFNVSSWSIRHPIPAVLLFILLTMLGLLSLNTMKVQSFPDIDLPMVTVTAALPGATPTQMETEVVRKLENAMVTLQGLKHIRASLQDGVATLTAEFRIEKPTQEALDDVRDAVSRVRADLPAALRDPVVRKVDLADTPVLTGTVSSPRMDTEALSWFVDNQLSRRLLAVPGVGAVTRVGGVTREINVELDPLRMLALDATAAEVSRQLREVQQEAAGGRTTLGGREQSVRTIATVKSAEELAAMELTLVNGRRIRLGDIATVKDKWAEQRQAALMDGRPVVSFEIARSRGAGELDVAKGVRAALAELEHTHPGIDVRVAIDHSQSVQDNYHGSMQLLYEGALLAILVVYAFLRNWRATLVSAAALPLSVIPAFAVMHWLGFTLNTVTLLSLSLVVGILVDDAIVEIENIMRHLGMGKTPHEAAMQAADEIGLAVIATTFTLIAVFLPTAFMGGIPGKFFVHFGWTASIAIFFSLMVARLLTPMMAAWLLKPSSRPEAEPGWMPSYLRCVHWCLERRGRTLLLVLGCLIGTLMLIPFLPTAFIPADDLSRTQVTVTLPPGSTLAQTQVQAERARKIAQANPHVTRVYTAIGGGNGDGDPLEGGGGADVRKAVMTLDLASRDQRHNQSRQDIEAALRKSLSGIPGARVKVGVEGGSEKYMLVLSGEDGQTLSSHARRVEKELRTLRGIGGVTSTASLSRPELVVRPDSARAADLGVSTTAIADTLRVALSGDYEQELSKLNLSQRQVPVVVRLPEWARGDLDLIGQLPVPGARGSVPLQNVASISNESGPAEIARYDRLRQISLEVELNQRALGDVEAEALALPSLRHLPTGITLNATGDAESMGELFQSFGLAMLMGVACIYFVLVLLFRDFVQPITILAALVLSVPGAFLALFLTHTGLSMPSLIGLVLLMGIATKNSILLVDYAILARRKGLSRHESLIDACRKRARPIVMTTVAMGAGMIPVALGLGADASFRSPMAIVTIGGLITSTFLSLLIVPLVFTYVDDCVLWLRNCFKAKPAS